ncbi:PrgI family protein [Candidatus Saccharibacteria bacterium]|nr:PrgI family protein [Candidatus Saccharibacteria bacterium]
MAQYKVPQDVEADDKLIGPFSFRQFVYLLVAAGLIALAVGLFQLFPLLALIPLPPVFLFLVLALPLKKDQPMETYLAAMVSYYLKPHTRVWTPGQRDSTILITAPKIVEDIRTRDITGEEATHRLSFLANLMDSEGYAIKGAGNSSMREDLVAEANAQTDMFDSYNSENLNKAISQNATTQRQVAMQEMQTALQNRENEQRAAQEAEQRRQQEEQARILAEQKRQREEAEFKLREEEMHRLNAEHEDALNSMRAAISRGNDIDTSGAMIQNNRGMLSKKPEPAPAPAPEPTPAPVPEPAPAPKKVATETPNASIIELANNPDFTVATIAKEANRLNKKEEGEVFVSLH